MIFSESSRVVGSSMQAVYYVHVEPSLPETIAKLSHLADMVGIKGILANLA